MCKQQTLIDRCLPSGCAAALQAVIQHRPVQLTFASCCGKVREATGAC